MPNAETTNAERLPVGVIRYGVDRPLPERREVRAGPLAAVVENADLRYVTVNGREVIRRIYMAVRNQNWDTVEPRFTAYQFQADGESFRVQFSAEHAQDDVDFAWDGTIEGTSAGVLTVTMDGVARTSFLKNRIGFCVLHPMDLAGTAVEVETPDRRVTGVFPERISPHQPFVDMVSIAHVAGENAGLTIRFEGDLFEMEDQRNWTDASYKTYSTPLRLPYPVLIEEGQRIRQTVTVEVTGSPSAAGTRDAELRVEVGRVPIGVLPPIGFGVASHGNALSQAEVESLRALRPAHLRVELDLLDADWTVRLGQAAEEAAALNAALQLAVLAGDAGEGFDGLVAALSEVRVPVARMLVFPHSELVTTEVVLRRARELADAAGLRLAIGGGSRAYFTELNRATLPLELMDVVGYTINPQVHAFDNLSLVETLAAQTETLRSAQAIVGDRPIVVGPITLRPRFNPNATGPVAAPGPGELPPEVDPRQISLFGAAWTLGSIRRLAEGGAAALTYYETTGWRGVLERSDGTHRSDLFPWRPGALFPLYHILADVAEFTGAELLSITTSEPLLVEALALRAGDRLRVLIASFSEAPREITVSLPPHAAAQVRYLDESNAAAAMVDRSALTGAGEPAGQAGSDNLKLQLRPFAIATIDARLTGG